MTTFTPGSLVRCREREWVVLPSGSEELLLLRPLGGSEREVTGIYLPLNRSLQIDPIEPATFPLPSPTRAGDAIAGRLLRDASRLTFRSGAGPFRSLGRINVRPRPFQIVPLLMALRLDPVRLLIADDVGIGKTIEAGLIARELLDRGDARRVTVLCPPHLCDQWQRELAEKFALDAVVIRSDTIAQLERALPPGDVNLFEHYPVTVVSIDFVKSPRRRATFLSGCGDLVIVDEAHTASRSASTRGTQQRHEVLRELARRPERHLILLTATPHSGVEDAFRSLLEQLDDDFAAYDLDHLTERQRRKMAEHFVQRRRADVQQWMGEETPFPQRESREVTYSLVASPEYRKLFDDIYAFARELVHRHDGDAAVRRRRVRYWTALALLRCVMSSPAAAQATLQARATRLVEEAPERDGESEGEHLFAEYVLDLDEEEVRQDFEPSPVVEEGEESLPATERNRLRAFARRAARLRGDADPKARVAAREVAQLLRDGFHPILFCRYIATADYLAAELGRQLRKEFPSLRILSVTGALSDDEREARVRELASEPVRVLVATDCLSEGINLQEGFSAVIHYDLPWNPNRLEQREGRVDRYGQVAEVVRTALLYGTDNPIDARVIDVLLRKAVSIHRSLGIMVPVPVDSENLVETVVRSLFEEEPHASQLSLFDTAPDLDLDIEDVHDAWDRAIEREKQSRTRFAQHAIKPEEVARELYESDAVLGDPATVQRFVIEACARLDAPLRPARAGSRRATWRLLLAELPLVVRERCREAFAPARGTAPDEVLIGFEHPLEEGAHLIGRLHPLTEALARYLLDSAIEGQEETPPSSRSGVTRTGAVTRRTTLLLLRIRMLINSPGETPVLAEELVIAGFEGHPGNLTWLSEGEAQRLLEEVQPAGNLSPQFRHSQLEEVLSWLPELDEDLEIISLDRAGALLDSHRRVRRATRTGRVSVEPQLPPDVLGMYVLLPVPVTLQA